MHTISIVAMGEDPLLMFQWEGEYSMKHGTTMTRLKGGQSQVQTPPFHGSSSFKQDPASRVPIEGNRHATIPASLSAPTGRNTITNGLVYQNCFKPNNLSSNGQGDIEWERRTGMANMSTRPIRTPFRKPIIPRKRSMGFLNKMICHEMKANPKSTSE